MYIFRHHREIVFIILPSANESLITCDASCYVRTFDFFLFFLFFYFLFFLLTDTVGSGSAMN